MKFMNIKINKNTILLILVVFGFIMNNQIQNQLNRQNNDITNNSSAIVPDFSSVTEKSDSSNILSTETNSISKLENFQSISHASFTINGNANFLSLATNESWAGTGSVLDPIIIKDLIFDPSYYAISISNTNLYFKIINNDISNSVVGIYFNNVTHATIENNLIANSTAYAIHLYFSPNNTVNTNTILNSYYSGIYIQFSQNNTIKNNIFTKSGLDFFYSVQRQTSVENNTLDGFPIVFFQDQSNFDIVNTVKQVILVSCSNVKISNQEISYVNQALQILNSTRISILNNVFSAITQKAVVLIQSPSNIIDSNKFVDNLGDLYLIYSTNQTITNNIFGTAGLEFGTTADSDFAHYLIKSNTVNSLPLEYITNQNGGVLPSLVGQLVLVNCTNLAITGYNFVASANPLIVSNSDKIEVKANTFVNTSHYGVMFLGVTNSVIIDNNFNGSRFTSVILYITINTVVTNNYFGNGRIQLYLQYADLNNIYSNTFINSYDDAIYAYESDNNTIYSNTFTRVSKALNLYRSAYNLFHDNIVVKASYTGVMIWQQGWNNITKNEFYQTVGYAIIIYSTTSNNLVISNDFIESGYYPKQLYDDGVATNVTMNFWSDWTSPDSDNDGFVDNPYVLDGSAGNSDPKPKAVPNSASLHTFTGLSIVNPDPAGGVPVNLTVAITWTPSIDSWYHDVNYTIYLSNDLGVSYQVLATNQTGTSYNWNTLDFANGPNYVLKIVSSDGHGLTETALMVNSFTIDNQHVLSIPTVLTPNGGEVLSGNEAIKFIVSTDSFMHPVGYYLYYSTDNGVSWHEIVANISVSEYVWDTTTVANGAYLIKVVAKDNYGLANFDTSDAQFKIENIVATVPGTTSLSSTVSIPSFDVLIGILSFSFFLALKKAKKI